jgi:hypothetical protein
MKKSVLVTIVVGIFAFIVGIFTQNRCKVVEKAQAWAEDVKEGMKSEEKPKEEQPAEKPEEKKTETPVSEAAEDGEDEEKKG